MLILVFLSCPVAVWAPGVSVGLPDGFCGSLKAQIAGGQHPLVFTALGLLGDKVEGRVNRSAAG